ncbi:MAG TPA: cytochrome ubiquinol oxidase subunit II [Oleiagrimonas sp.]|nr:cytochrome ubiquinol oxidase subunit II [Oleiagrimonas sp.]
MKVSRIMAAWRHWVGKASNARYALFGAALLLSGCSGAPHFSFLDPQGPVANAERWHFYIVLGIMAVLVAAPIFLVMPFVLWRYRYGNKRARYAPKWKFSRLIEIFTWAGPVIIVCILGFFVWRDAHRLDPYKPLPSDQPALQVQVIGYDWKWLFIYPKLGIATIGTLGMPAGRPVSMHLTSATVMQSFFIPSLGSQIYAMGGMVTQLNLEASRPGTFLGENTMYSGKGFHKQKFTAVALAPDDFKAWVKKVRNTGMTLDGDVLKTIAERGTLAQLITDLPPAASHDGSVYLTGVTPTLFRAVVKSTMRGTRVVPGNGSTPAHATTTRPSLTKTRGKP